MTDPLDELEVAKLATFIGSQLRKVDKETDGVNVPANRIDPKNFIKNVVSATRNNEHYSHPTLPQIKHENNLSEEQKILDLLNKQALVEVPDISSNKPTIQNKPIILKSDANVQNSDLGELQSTLNVKVDVLLEIAQSIKSIDVTLKNMCDILIESKKKKTNKKQKNPKSKLSQPKQQPLPKI